MAYVALFLAVAVDNAVRLFLPPFSWAGRLLPDLPLLTALYVGFHARHTGQLWFAVMQGVFADCLSSCPLGHFAFLYGAAAYLAWRMRRFLPPDAAASYAVATLVCALCTVALGALVALLSSAGAPSAGAAAAAARAVGSALVAPFVYGLWERSRLFRRALGGRAYYEFAA